MSNATKQLVFPLTELSYFDNLYLWIFCEQKLAASGRFVVKKSLTLLLIIVVLGSFFVEPKRAEATGESMHVRKVVSLVYDDSSSMSGGEGYKKAYANYAVQSFCGLLDTEDQLFITYMYNSKSTPNYLPEETDLSSQGIQGALDKIRAHNDEGSTPFRSVEIAFEKLKSVQDADPNTQYWLVVFTDGDFNEIQGESSDYKQQFLDEHFSELVQTRMPNGTYPNITFVAIGSEVYYPKEDTSSGLYTFFANGEKEIFSAMSGMAEMISGKTKVSTDKLFQLDEKTIQVSSEIPLRKIAILTQDTDAEIVSVGGDDGSVDIERKAHMNYPKGNLNGEAYLAGNGNASLSAGTYKITFDKPIGREGVEVLFEPALEVRIKIKVGEKEITNISELNSYTEGDQINISCGVYEIGTQNEVDVSLLPGGTSMVFTVRAGNEVRQSDKPGEEIRDYVLKNTSTEIVSELSIPGFNTIRQKVEFLPQPAPEYSLTSVLVGGPSIHYDDLAQNESLRILYTVMKDGEAVNDLNIVKSFATAHILNPIGDGNTEYLDTGQIVFTPTSVTVEKGASGT